LSVGPVEIFRISLGTYPVKGLVNDKLFVPECNTINHLILKEEIGYVLNGDGQDLIQDIDQETLFEFLCILQSYNLTFIFLLLSFIFHINLWSMHYLLLSIICSTSILVIFRYVGKFGLNTFNTIIINYIVASILGIILSYRELSVFFENSGKWMLFAIMIGVAFVVIFYVMAITTQKLGITVSSIASRMSVIIPVVFSILYENETIGFLKLAGIIFAILALFLMVQRKNGQGFDKKLFFLPFLLFLGVGVVDSTIKYSQVEFLGTIGIIPFSTLLFSIAAFSAISFQLIRPGKKMILNQKTLLFGLLLGLVNFGSLFFFISALSHGELDSSVIFGINNLGIVMLSILAALLAFREKLTKLNWAGVFLSIIAILILSYSS
jgi:drug/metabolite transporter (DMT)-like permease